MSYRQNKRQFHAITFFILSLFTFSFTDGQGIFGISAGYGFGAGLQRIGTNYNYMEDMTTGVPSTTSKKVYATIGRGFNFNVEQGWMINHQIGLGIEFNFFTGLNVTTSDTTDEFSAVHNRPPPNEDKANKVRLNSCRLVPFMIFKTNPLGNFILYGRIGLQLNLLNSLKQMINNNDGEGYYIYNVDTTVKGHITPRFIAAIGTDYKLSEHFNLSFELLYNNFYFSPASAAIATVQTSAYNSFGLNVGFHYIINKKTANTNP